MTFDVAVIGTGAVGATVARELSKRGLKALILEKGKRHKVGTSANHIKNVPIKLKIDLIDKNEENLDFLQLPAELMYIEDVGGTTQVSLANACYACSTCYSNSATTQFQIHNLDLFKELIEASGDLKVNSFPADLMGPATREIVECGESLGVFMEPMPNSLIFLNVITGGVVYSGLYKGSKRGLNTLCK